MGLSGPLSLLGATTPDGKQEEEEGRRSRRVSRARGHIGEIQFVALLFFEMIMFV